LFQILECMILIPASKKVVGCLRCFRYALPAAPALWRYGSQVSGWGRSNVDKSPDAVQNRGGRLKRPVMALLVLLVVVQVWYIL
jgi:hypothetical protein